LVSLSLFVAPPITLKNIHISIDPRTHPDMKLLTPLSGRDTLMHEILERLGFPLEKLDTVFSATAAHFVYPCHSPLRHPYLWQRVRRMLGVQREEGAPKKVIALFMAAHTHTTSSLFS